MVNKMISLGEVRSYNLSRMHYIEANALELISSAMSNIYRDPYTEKHWNDIYEYSILAANHRESSNYPARNIKFEIELPESPADAILNENNQLLICVVDIHSAIHRIFNEYENSVIVSTMFDHIACIAKNFSRNNCRR